MAERKKQNLLTGAGVLAIASVLVKLIGLFYKIPLTNLITVEGYAYFTGAYAIYNPVYAISMAGLPVTVSKLVSQNIQQGKFRDANAIFHIARKIFLAIGIFSTVLLICIAVPYAKFVGSQMNYVAIITIAPSILFCCQMSSYRGYYEGMKNMKPTGISQVIEAAAKLLVGLAATYICFNMWLNNYHNNAVDGVATVFGVEVKSEAEALHAMYPYAAAVAIFGVTLGSMFGLLFLWLMNRKKHEGFTKEELENSPEPQSGKAIAKNIIYLAIPISITSIVSYLSTIIDDITIRTRLDKAIEVGLDTIKSMYASSFEMAGTLDSGIKNYLYGCSGSVTDVKNLIPTITLTFGISAIPVLSAVWSKIQTKTGDPAENKIELKKSIETVIRMCMLIALPAGLGFATLAEPILRLLYGSQPDILPITVPMLETYGVAMFLFSVSPPITSMLQAIGKTKIPLISIAIASAVKIIMNYTLIAIPSINIHGAPISTTICYAIIVTINLCCLIHFTKVRINFVSVFLKPLISAICSSAAAWGTYWLLATKLSLGNTIGTVVAVLVAIAIYVFIFGIIKGFVYDDIIMLPKGEKIAKVLAKLRFLG